ncbi:limbic system-associated membrane protein-like [Antedon mediterranea]|uniref:limbic system-associated membrane protein-like n=1 Tax=Antedon mediterranea TaxID=105859 RepID=UPI003AF6AEF9
MVFKSSMHFKSDCTAMFLVVNMLLYLLLKCEAVRFSQFSEGLTVVEHDAVNLECKLKEKHADDLVSWKGIENMPGNRYTLDENGDDIDYTFTLTIKSVDRTDKGEYKCQIITREGRHMERTLILTVLEIPGDTYPVCAELPTATEGQPITLSCNSEMVEPAPVLKWYKKDKFNGSLYELNTFEQKHEDDIIKLELTLTPTAENNKDVYVCKLTTETNLEWSRECKRVMHVRYKPIVNISGSPTVEVGRETVFICEAQTSSATYSWNYSLPTSRVRLEADNQILRYHDPRPEDNGNEITCIAANDVGSSSKKLVLYVLEFPIKPPIGPSHAPETVYNQNSKTRSLSFVTAVAGGCTTILLVLLIMFAGCIHYHTNRDFRNTSLVAQPDVYFEPRDRVLHMPHGSCMRSIGVQVPRDIESESVYHEIESRKSGSSCSAKNYSTGATSV